MIDAIVRQVELLDRQVVHLRRVADPVVLEVEDLQERNLEDRELGEVVVRQVDVTEGEEVVQVGVQGGNVGVGDRQLHNVVKVPVGVG